ncbi:MAG: hypothetical protein AB1792_08740 [Candidatus Zixiibacteriota bacterium]
MWSAVMAAVCVLAIVGCSGGRHDRVVPANEQSSELFDRSYGYLVKGDPDFLRLAPNYSALRPFSRDTSIMIETHSEHEGKTPPPEGYTEYFHVRLNKPMSVRLIVADTTGNGLITYEYEQVPAGTYTMGSKGWPVPQLEATKGMPWVYVYWVTDQRFRMKHQFRLDKKQHFTYMPTPPQPS